MKTKVVFDVPKPIKLIGINLLIEKYDHVYAVAWNSDVWILMNTEGRYSFRSVSKHGYSLNGYHNTVERAIERVIKEGHDCYQYNSIKEAIDDLFSESEI